MPHLTFEYTANIEANADLDGLLRKAHEVLIAQDDVFSTGGIRSRALRLDHYRMADGAADYAFVHATLKIGAGRDEACRRRVGDALFAMMQEHFAALFAARYLALSLEIAEFGASGTWKHNNVHARFRPD
ncbi:MAG: 5-carboxymethyl-2-hydroxymuconate Delta-isomerase [Gammaproteobacteria bacterium]|nr:5-carboxymethyl-2-hydroxymuconate Delta-isomerase [Gammaproteobacteria bacterium]